MGRSELISPVLRMNFREFCVNAFALRQIDEFFALAGVARGEVPAGRIVSGQRRTLVEEYYATLDWCSQTDANKFIKAIQIAYGQTYMSKGERQTIKEMLQPEGYIIQGMIIRKITQDMVEYTVPTVELGKLKLLHDQLITLGEADPQQRGYLFEQLLQAVFDIFNLKPRGGFRLQGEQIDGSFELGQDTYLVEAKWRTQPTAQPDLLVFREKVESKSTWSRGLFISYNGFSSDALEAFSRGRATNIIGIDGQDLHFILSGKYGLIEAIQQKARSAAETGRFYTSVFELMRS